MKKLLCIFMVVLCFTGCGQSKIKEQEEEMKKYATVYYEDYMKNVNGQVENEISIQALKEVNQKIGSRFDLTKLASCKDSSYVTVVVHPKTREIQKYHYHLNCK